MASYLIRSDDWQSIVLRLRLALLMDGAIDWNRPTTTQSDRAENSHVGRRGICSIRFDASLAMSADGVSRVIQGIAAGIRRDRMLSSAKLAQSSCADGCGLWIIESWKAQRMYNRSLAADSTDDRPWWLGAKHESRNLDKSHIWDGNSSI